MESMIGMEYMPFPDEIILKILRYLRLGELIQCARVSKKLNTICKDGSLSYRSSMLAMKDLTVKDWKSIIDMLIARPEVTEVRISSITRKWSVQKTSRRWKTSITSEWGLKKQILGASCTWRFMGLYEKSGVLHFVISRSKLKLDLDVSKELLKQGFLEYQLP
jgi:hypothetical protein